MGVDNIEIKGKIDSGRVVFPERASSQFMIFVYYYECPGTYVVGQRR